MRPKRILGCDVDSTIWDLAEVYCAALSKELGREVSPAEWTSWAWPYNQVESDVATRLFEESLDPSKVEDRTLYPNCQKVIRGLQHGYEGFRVVFITHNHNPDGIVPTLTPWLRQRFGSGVGVVVMKSDESKLDLLRSLNAWGMLDDRPDFITEVADEGMFAAAMRHPYNKLEVDAHPNVYDFNNWHEIPSMVKDFNFRGGGSA